MDIDACLTTLLDISYFMTLRRSMLGDIDIFVILLDTSCLLKDNLCLVALHSMLDDRHSMLSGITHSMLDDRCPCLILLDIPY